MSVNAHFGIEQSRRDDLESLGYLLFYFLKGGKLPWMGFRVDNTRYLAISIQYLHDIYIIYTRERFRRIGLCKQQLSIHSFCSGQPREFGTFLRYVRGLRFSDAPDYNYLK